MIKPYYQDSASTVYLADCREVLPELPVYDLLLTDPPYGKVTRPSAGLRNLDRGAGDKELCDLMEVLPIAAEKCRGSFYVFCPREYISHLAFFFFDYSARLCIWEKNNASPMNGQHLWLSNIECCMYAKKPGGVFNGSCESAVWTGPTEPTEDHPTEKPEWLMRKLILASSNPGDLVVDLYMGSGSALRAAKDLGRRAIGVDIRESYCELTAKRLRQEVLF